MNNIIYDIIKQANKLQVLSLCRVTIQQTMLHFSQKGEDFMMTQEKIGKFIAKMRKEKDLTQEQFAERIEVSPQYISDLERGVVGIAIPTLKRACVALGTSSDQILFGVAMEKRNAAIEKRCADLSDDAFSALMDIVDVFSAAIKKASSDH